MPGLNDGALPEDRASAVGLQDRLRQLEVEGPQGTSMSPLEDQILNRTYRLDENRLGLQALALHREGGALVLTLTTTAGEKALRLGATGWEGGEVALDMPMALPVAGSARWSGENELWAALIYLNPAATRTIKLRFAGNDVEARNVLSGTFAPPDEIVIAGR